MPRVLWNVVVFVLLAATAAVAQLPPEIQADRYLLAARQAIEGQDFTGAQAALDKMSLLETEQGLELPEEFYFRSAQVAHQTRRPARAVQMVTRYLEMAGRDGKHYIEALELLNAAEAETFNAAQTCEGKSKGSECWKELANQPGCHVWNDDLVPDQTVTWTGECAESLAQGAGTLKWVSDGGKNTTESSGRIESGKHHGRWKTRDSNGHVHEGPYERGKRHGQWVIQWADDNGDLSGNKTEGPFVEGKMQGLWTARWTDGSIEKRPYVDGKIHGQLTGRDADGDTWEVEYVEGKKHGKFTQRTADGKVSSQGPFVEGQKHGAWTERVWKGTYVEGKRHGRWVWRDDDGQIVEQGSYVKGERHGHWVDKYERAAGKLWEEGSGSYKEGQRHGLWIWKDDDGTSARGSYVEGKEHGDWVVVRDKGGDVEEGPYVEGKRHGEWMVYPDGKKSEHMTIPYNAGWPEPLMPEMVVIPGGRFRMGCVSGRDCEDDEQPVHEVRVESFELGKYEVTFEEYDRFTAATGRDRAGDSGWGRGRLPVIDVSWEDAVAYTEWLSEQTGEQYRLPSEAEWEYAARAGTATTYHFGKDKSELCRYGNHADSSTDYDWRNKKCSDGVGKKTARVGGYWRNPYGLHDMQGNVWEWVQDCGNESYRGAPVDGSAWESGDCSQRVLRGASWFNDPRGLRSAFRHRIATAARASFFGFRVARTITP